VDVESGRLEDLITERLGLSVVCKLGREQLGQYLDVSPEELDPSVGFSVHVLIGWRSVETRFVPGNFSAGLISEMCSSEPSDKSRFSSLAVGIIESGTKIKMIADGSDLNPVESNGWPEQWHSLVLETRRAPVPVDSWGIEERERVLVESAVNMLCLLLSLLPLEVDWIPDETLGLPEGAVARIEVNRYERSALNRAACIQHHGCGCSVCGLEFGKTYGPAGDGYIHVHHIVPVSKLGNSYKINPLEDLIPICPNCHAIMHRRNPPYSAEEIRTMIKPFLHPPP